VCVARWLVAWDEKIIRHRVIVMKKNRTLNVLDAIFCRANLC
jgi:hypothetical protein